ncbi:hypothetical protein EF879_26880, partial [Micromonospora sp. HM5-17]
TQARRAVVLPTPETTTPHPASPVPAPTVEPPASSAEAPVPVVPAVSMTPLPVTPAGPAETSTPVPAAVELDGLGIPAAMQAQIRQLVADSAAPVTPADIQRATRLPLSVATKVVERLTPVNGYAH